MVMLYAAKNNARDARSYCTAPPLLPSCVLAILEN